MKLLAVTAMLCTVASAPTAHAQTSGLASSVRACRAGEAVACDTLEKQLERLFVGSNGETDRALGHKLAAAVTKVLHDHGGPRIIAEPIARCSANDLAACKRIATVLAGLFTGSDAQLDGSRDRVFARALANRLVGEVQR